MAVMSASMTAFAFISIQTAPTSLYGYMARTGIQAMCMHI